MYAVLHIADFDLNAVLRTESGASGRPAALFTDTRRKSVVLAANPAARSRGIETGMSAPQAMARCPGLVIRTPNTGASADARAALLAASFMLSPTIEDTAPGVCTIDLKGRDPDKIKPATTSAIAELAHLGLPATAGIAATPLLALYAARAAAQNLSLSSFSLSFSPDDIPASGLSPHASRLSPHASRLSPPAPRIPHPAAAPLLVTDPVSFLAPLPLSTADPSPALADILRQWGLRTLGDLTALSRDDIGRRLGPEGLALWDRAGGGAPRPLHPVASPRTFEAAFEFEEAIETLEPLLFVLRRFLDRLTLELRASGFAASELELTLSPADGHQHVRHFRMAEPTTDPGILFRTLHTHLESLQTDAPIGSFHLRATPARPLVRQHGLFDTGLRDPHAFAETLARAGVLAGAGCIGTPRREDTHRPDVVTLVAPAAIVPPSAEAPVHPPIGLPLRRFRPPLAATLEFTAAGDRPTGIHTTLFQGDIVDIRGPWRGSGDWWQPDRAWERIEYDIALAGGGLYRLLQTGGAWFIEGEYD